MKHPRFVGLRKRRSEADSPKPSLMPDARGGKKKQRQISNSRARNPKQSRNPNRRNHDEGCTLRVLGFSVKRASRLQPSAALTVEPASVPIFPASSRSPFSARPAINSDIVKPMPPRQPAPSMIFQLAPDGSRATPSRAATQLKSSI